MSDANDTEVREGGSFPNAVAPGEIVSGDDLKEIVAWLTEKLDQYLLDQSSKRTRWATWRRQFENEIPAESKQYPIENASNLSVPLSQIHGQTAFAKVHSMYSQKEPFWAIRSMRTADPEAHADAELMTKYFDLMAKSPNDLNLASVRRNIHQETAVMGTCWVKVPWTRQAWNFQAEAGTGGGVSQISSVLHDGPEIVMMQNEDVLYDDSWNDINYLPMIAHVVHKPWHELKNAEANGVYVNIDQLEGQARTSRLDQDAANDAVRSAQPKQGDVWDLYECYFYWDVNRDGVYEDLIFTLHKDTGAVIRQDYNSLGVRPFEPFRFMSRTFAFDGRGTGQTCEYLQDEANGIHNLTNDNMKIANMKMFKARRSVIQANRETIRPGKIWIMDDPQADMTEFSIGEVYPSSTQREMMTLNYAAQATNISEVMRGFADSTLQSRDTFGGQQLRLGQSQGVLASVAEGIGESWSRIGLLIFFQLVRHREDVINNERKMMRLNDDEIARLDRLLSTPIQDIRQMMNFTIRSTEPDETRQGKQQATLAATQMYSQYAQQTMPLAQQLFGPQGQQMAQAAPELYRHMMAIYVGSTKFLKDSLELMGVDDALEYLPDVKQLEEVLKQMRQAQVAQPQGAMNGPQAGGVVPGGNLAGGTPGGFPAGGVPPTGGGVPPIGGMGAGGGAGPVGPGPIPGGA